jgi:hypothetical protein
MKYQLRSFSKLALLQFGENCWRLIPWYQLLFIAFILLRFKIFFRMFYPMCENFFLSFSIHSISCSSHSDCRFSPPSLGRQSQQIFCKSWRILQGGLRDEAEHGDQHAAAAEQSQHPHQAPQPRQIQVS